MDLVKKIDKVLKTADLVYTKTDGVTKYYFNKFMFPIDFILNIYYRSITLQEAKNDQLELESLMNDLNNGYNPRNQLKIKEKNNVLGLANKLLVTTKDIINAFKKGIFPNMDGFHVEKESDEEKDEETDEESTLENEESDSDTSIEGSGLKILTPNQMLSRLPISLAQLKAGNNSEKLKNEIRQILYSLYRSKN